MLRPLLCVALLSFAMSCKSVRSESSDVKAWELEGSRSSAKEYIISTIVRCYPQVSASDPVLGQFAEALMDAKTDQTESADYVLQTLWQQSQRPASPGEDSPIDSYIIQEWAVQTNFVLDDGKKPLRLLNTLTEEQ